jgi:hypothetical protein
VEATLPSFFTPPPLFMTLNVCRPSHCSPRCETFRSAVVDTGGPSRNVQKALWLAVSAGLGLIVVGNVSDAGAALKLTGVFLWRLSDQGFELLFTRDRASMDEKKRGLGNVCQVTPVFLGPKTSVLVLPTHGRHCLKFVDVVRETVVGSVERPAAFLDGSRFVDVEAWETMVVVYEMYETSGVFSEATFRMQVFRRRRVDEPTSVEFAYCGPLVLPSHVAWDTVQGVKGVKLQDLADEVLEISVTTRDNDGEFLMRHQRWAIDPCEVRVTRVTPLVNLRGVQSGAGLYFIRTRVLPGGDLMALRSRYLEFYHAHGIRATKTQSVSTGPCEFFVHDCVDVAVVSRDGIEGVVVVFLNHHYGLREKTFLCLLQSPLESLTTMSSFRYAWMVSVYRASTRLRGTIPGSSRSRKRTRSRKAV